MGLGEGLTQSQGVAMSGLTRQGYEGWRVEKHLMNAVTPAGTVRSPKAATRRSASVHHLLDL